MAALLQERQKQLESLGISLQSSGIKVGDNKCFLVNLNADPALNELLVYYLKVKIYINIYRYKFFNRSGLLVLLGCLENVIKLHISDTHGLIRINMSTTFLFQIQFFVAEECLGFYIFIVFFEKKGMLSFINCLLGFFLWSFSHCFTQKSIFSGHISKNAYQRVCW